MPRPFDVTTDSPASVDQIHLAFGSEAYWHARIAEFGSGATTLDHLTVDPAGTVDVATTQDLRNDLLPGPLAKAFRGDVKVVRAEIWRRDEHTVQGEVTITASGIPGSGVVTAVLEPISEGSRLTLGGTLEIRIPLVGGRIEKAIADQIVAELPQLTRFTSDWISQNG